MRAALVFLVVLGGCRPPPLPVDEDPAWQPPAEECTPARCSTGSGSFGEWLTDARGLPGYRYALDQQADPRAVWVDTEQRERRDHWFAFGNSRVNAFFSNDGPVEVVLQDRGVTYLNKRDDTRRNFGGGFSFIDDGEARWCTAYAWRPKPSATRREASVGAALAETTHRGLRSTRRLLAPEGDDAVVIAEVTLTNTSQVSRSLKHYEYWDVARRDITINWLVSGDPFENFPGDALKKREAQNADFSETVWWDAAQRALVLRREPVAGFSRPARDVPGDVDFYPPDVFLAVLDGPADALHVDQAAFFGDGPPSAATLGGEAVAPVDGVVAAARRGNGQTRMFVIRSDLELRAGESRTLRFAFGAVEQAAPVEVREGWKTAEPFVPPLLRFTVEGGEHLERELAWHAWQLEASVGRREYWGQHVVPQGSAYLYLHGADGAARDLGLFTLPLVYTHPSLAREELTLYMKVQHADGERFSYAFQGHGQLDDALGLHSAPSDLDLFFLWALAEYVGATGDVALLDARVPYWPVGARPTATGWDHVRSAVRHLLDVVGTGPHGLVRVGTGDWSDGIVVESTDRARAIAMGESVPNTQMALAVLPRVAELLETRDAALAAEVRARLPQWCSALKAHAWSGEQFGRAYFGDGALVRATTPDLEAQVWGLIGDCFPAAGDRGVLVERVRSRLDAPSAFGATLQPGADVWPAISALLTKGYVTSGRDDLAFEHLKRNTMARKAVAFPDQWWGIWSGPDGQSSKSGRAWKSPATPMTDFPVQNNNQHAMPLIAALWVAGVEARFDGLVVAPPPRKLKLETQLLDLERDGAVISGVYRKVGPGPRTLEVVAGGITRATLDGVEVPASGGAVRFTVTQSPASFRVETAP